MSPGQSAIGILSMICLCFSFPRTTTAQGAPKEIPRAILPSDAMIVENAKLHVRGGKARVLVLWMSNPKRVEVSWDSGSDFVYGDHWFGPTSLSLIDPANRQLINTIRIHSPDETPGNAGGYSLPFIAWDGPYYVPHPDKNRKGTPLLLNLKDLTGEGVAGQFALFDYAATGVSLASVFGYSPISDRAVQYPTELKEGKFRPVIQPWATQIFATKPISPGYWKFTWEAGHGSWAWIDETVRFDPARQLFAERRNIRPYPDFAQTHCDLGIESLAELFAALRQAIPDVDDGVGGLIGTTPRDRLVATSVVATYQGEKVLLQVEWLISDTGRIGLEFTAPSNLADAVQAQGKTWCSSE